MWLFFGGGLRRETAQVFELGLGADIRSCTSDDDHYIYHDDRTVRVKNWKEAAKDRRT